MEPTRDWVMGGAGAVVASALSASDSTTGSESGTTDMTRIPQGKGNSDGHSMWQTAARTGGSLALRGVTPGLRDGPKQECAPPQKQQALDSKQLVHSVARVRSARNRLLSTRTSHRFVNRLAVRPLVHHTGHQPPGKAPLPPAAGLQRRSAAVSRAMDSDRRRPHDVVDIA